MPFKPDKVACDAGLLAKAGIGYVWPLPCVRLLAKQPKERIGDLWMREKD
jgi:hypothetical protein